MSLNNKRTLGEKESETEADPNPFFAVTPEADVHLMQGPNRQREYHFDRLQGSENRCADDRERGTQNAKVVGRIDHRLNRLATRIDADDGNAIVALPLAKRRPAINAAP